MRDFVTVYVHICVWRADFIISPLILQIWKPQPNYPLCLLFLTLSLYISLSISREITVLRQFLGVPSDAHIVGQRFHCHQVGGLRTFVVCVCVCARIYLFQPVFLFM